MSLRDAGFFTTVAISHRLPLNLKRNNSGRGREVTAALANLLAGQGVGLVDGLVLNANQATMGAAAGATLVYATASGSVPHDSHRAASPHWTVKGVDCT